MGVDNIRFESDTEVNELFIHNAPLPYECCLPVKPVTRYSIEKKRMIFLKHLQTKGVLHSHALFPASCTYVDILKVYHCRTLSNVMTLIFDLLYVLPCVILFFCFSVIIALRLPRLGKRELILVLFVRLFDLCMFGFVGFLFLLVSGKGCGL